MPKNIELSLIIATFNSEKTVSLTLDSILNQDYNDFETIVIDGSSGDSTVELLKSYEEKFKKRGVLFKWISEKDSGIYDAWNKGLNLARGKWIAFIGSDDCLVKNALNGMSSFGEKYPKVDFISARTKIVANGEVVREFGKQWRWNEFKKEMKVLHAGGWHNANYFKKYGVFDSSYQITGDYEMLLRAKSELKTAFYNGYIIKMGAGGASDGNVYKALKEACRAKIRTGRRGCLTARVEMYFIYFKILLKRMLG